MPNNSELLLSDLININKLVIDQEDNHLSIIEKILEAGARYSSADGYFFYNIDNNDFMSLSYSHIQSIPHPLNYFNDAFFNSTNLSEIKKKPLKRPAELCAVNREIINSDNILAETNVDVSYIKRFDEKNDYSTISDLAIPLIGRKNKLLGVVQFINATDGNGKIINFTAETIDTLISICNLLTLFLENESLREAYSQLLESFIASLARAIDAKSPHTGKHCQQVPIIARMLATAAVEEDSGPLKNFDMNEDEWYALHIASWLHDCGKITTPEYIVDKGSKLETINNRIHEIRNRFEILRRDAHIAYLQKRLAGIDKKENLQAQFVAKVKQLEEDFAFVAQCNIGDIPLTEKDINRLNQISQQKFTRYFNRMLGLSWTEKNSVKSPEIYSKPATENLLQNCPEHHTTNYNNGELHNLSIPKGTINSEERQKINEHVQLTIDMLKALPLPQELSNVVEYAGCHHEWVNGKGYPNHLTGDQMSVPAKIMAIADVFEALTSRDRPYKSPKKLSQILQMMQQMKQEGHLDPDLYQVFITHKVYQEYASSYLEKEQIDEIIPENYL